MTKYTHLKLNQDIRALAGYYTPQKEVRLKYNGREVLYIIGQTVVDASCCGLTDFSYAQVPGYIIRWQPETDKEGFPVSEVEPISDKTARDDIRKIIQEAEPVIQIEFWQS
jgi:hypothetical protein